MRYCLLGLFILGFLLRIWWLPGHLFFGYEQGRDALVVQKIIGGKLTLLGPKTDVEGIFHGPFFYYLLAVPYFFSGGNPAVASFFLVFLASLTIPAIYLLAKEMFTRRVGLVAAALYAFSYGAVVSSRWLANPTLVPLSTVLLILSVLKIVRGEEKYWLLFAAAAALTVHLEVVAILCLGPAILIFLFSERVEISNKKLFFSSWVLFLTLVFSYPLFELRHDFLMTKSLLAFLKDRFRSGGLEFQSLFKVVKLYFEQFRLLVTPFFSGGTVLFFGGMVVLWSRIKERGHKLLFLWLLTTPLVLFFFPDSALFHLFLGVGPAFILLVSVLICLLWEKRWPWLSFSLGVFLLVLNVFSWQRFLPENRKVFFQAGQRLFKYSDMLAAIDWVYQSAESESFSLHPFTIPYFSDDAWYYLFSWYGERKYGYLPEEPAEIFYTVYQPSEGQPWFLESWLEKEEEQGRKTGEEKFGVIGVEKRKARFL